MKAAVFVGPGRIALDERPIPEVGPTRADLTPLVIRHFSFDQVETAYEPFSHQGDGVLKVAIKA